MTITKTSNKQAAQVMGTNYDYPFTFEALLKDPTEDDAKEAIKCKILNTTTNIESTLTYSTDYFATLNADQDSSPGGTVTVVNRQTSDYTITIYSEYKLTQESDYKDFNSFPADTLESDLDKTRLIDQQQAEKLSRALVVPITAPSDFDGEMPYPIAQKALVINNDGTGFTLSNDNYNDQAESAASSASSAIIAATNSAINAAAAAASAALVTGNSDITLRGNTFNGANQLVQLDASGKLPAVDGSLLTNLNISTLFDLTSGNTLNGESDVLSGVGTTILSFKVDDGSIYKPLGLAYVDNSRETAISLANITGILTTGTYTVLKEKGQNPIAINMRGITDGTAISGGDQTGTNVYPKEYAFDGNYAAPWGSSQMGAGINGAAYIGKSYSSAKTISKLRFNQSAFIAYCQTSVKLQTSTDGTNWIDVQTFSGLTGLDDLILNTPLSTLKFRLLANSAQPAGNFWAVNEIDVNPVSITQGKTFPANPVNGDRHCLTACGLDSRIWNSTTSKWEVDLYVPMGGYTVSGGIITSVWTNPYNQNGYNINQQTVKKYDSGLFPVTINNAYTRTHNLGSSNIKYVVLIADDVNGTNQRPALPYLQLGGSLYGWEPGPATSTTLSIKTAAGYVGVSADFTSSVTSAYYKILAEVIQ